MPVEVGTAAVDGNMSGIPPTSCHTMRKQDGMFTHWDERLVAQMVINSTQAVSPTMVSLSLASCVAACP